MRDPSALSASATHLDSSRHVPFHSAAVNRCPACQFANVLIPTTSRSATTRSDTDPDTQAVRPARPAHRDSNQHPRQEAIAAPKATGCDSSPFATPRGMSASEAKLTAISSPNATQPRLRKGTPRAGGKRPSAPR